LLKNDSFNNAEAGPYINSQLPKAITRHVSVSTTCLRNFTLDFPNSDNGTEKQSPPTRATKDQIRTSGLDG